MRPNCRDKTSSGNETATSESVKMEPNLAHPNCYEIYKKIKCGKVDKFAASL